MATFEDHGDDAQNGPRLDLDQFAPRISIEAFCLTPEFAAAMKAAAGDRRMVKARAHVAMGGAKAARDRFANVASPDLLVVQVNEDSFGVFEELAPLAEVCDPETHVVVVGVSNDVTLYRELLRQGVAEYLVQPVAPSQLIECVTGLFSDPERAPTARSVAVYGVKGGVGASAIAQNLSWIAADRLEKDTILVDLDLAFGSAALGLNVEARSSLSDVLMDIDGLDDVKLTRMLTPVRDGLRLLASPANITSKSRFDDHSVLTLLDALRRAADLVVLDAPHGWTDAAHTALAHADEVVLVATPDLTSLRNLKSVHGWLTANRANDAPPRIVLNQVGAPKRPEIPAAEFADIIGAPVATSCAYDAAAFGQALNKGAPLAQLGLARKSVESLAALAKTLATRPSEAAAQRKAGASGGGSWLAALTGR